ncbi:MAG: hypothetical protein L6Q69_06525 [Zoogloea sp.]|jgi:hypothetical protein|nr:hypothetical protein [Zoogloea sp.]
MELTIDPVATSRMFMIYLHLLALAGAASAVALGDYAIFARERIDSSLLRRAATFATIALAVLWATGIAVIVLDLGMDLDALLGKPKLLAKLTVVAVLTFNSLALHFVAFPTFRSTHDDALRAATMPSVFGAVSAASWIYAAFIGVAKPLASAFGYSGFIALFIVMLVCAVTMAIVLVRPRLAARLSGSVPPIRAVLAA